MWPAFLLTSILIIDLAPVNAVTIDQSSLVCGESAAACTEVRGGLAVWCVKSESGWKIRTSVRLTPVIYLSSPKLEDHERSHLADLELRVKNFQEWASSRSFELAAECRSAADDERLGFPSRLKSFARQSNARLH